MTFWGYLMKIMLIHIENKAEELRLAKKRRAEHIAGINSYKAHMEAEERAAEEAQKKVDQLERELIDMASKYDKDNGQ